MNALAHLGRKAAGHLAFAGALLAPALAHAQEPTTPSAADVCLGAYNASIAATKAGKLLEARAQLATCAAESCGELGADCRQRLPELTARIPTIVFDVKDPDGHDLTPVKLTIDGALYTEHLSGASLTLDPVDHEFTFEVPGQPPITKRFVLHDREARRELITIGTATPRPPVPAPPPPIEVVAQPTSSHWSTQKIVGYSLVGVGVLAAGIGSGFGLDAISKQNAANSPSKCPQKNQCYQDGATLIDQAKTDATVSTVLFVIAGAAVAGGVTMVLISPSQVPTPSTTGATHDAQPPRLQLLLGSPRSLAGVSLEGAF